jgi:hypothetical protein
MKLIDFNHTKAVGETYLQHLWWCIYATMFYMIMIVLSVIHGFFPFLLPNVPDRMLVNFINKFRERRTRTGQAAAYPERVREEKKT